MNDDTMFRDDPFAARVGLGLRELDGLEAAPDVRADVLRRLREPGAASSPERRPRWVLLVALLAVAVTATVFWEQRARGDDAQVTAAHGQDPRPVRLVYELAEGTSELDASLRALRRRLGTLGTVAGDGRTVTVTLADARDVATARTLIEGDDLLEMRMVADADYVGDGGSVRFDLAAERRRLAAWLEEGGRERLRADPRAIRTYEGAGRHLRWHVHRVRPRADRPELWGLRFVDVPALARGTVAVHTEAEWNDGSVPQDVRARPAEAQVLLELVAVNLHEWHVRGRHVDPASVQLVDDRDGRAAVQYALRRPHAARFADLSGEHVGRCLAILWDDEVVTAPAFRSRIPGRGQLEGFPPGLAETVARVLATSSEAELVFVRSEPGDGR